MGSRYKTICMAASFMLAAVMGYAQPGADDDLYVNGKNSTSGRPTWSQSVLSDFFKAPLADQNHILRADVNGDFQSENLLGTAGEIDITNNANDITLSLDSDFVTSATTPVSTLDFGELLVRDGDANLVGTKWPLLVKPGLENWTELTSGDPALGLVADDENYSAYLFPGGLSFYSGGLGYTLGSYINQNTIVVNNSGANADSSIGVNGIAQFLFLDSSDPSFNIGAGHSTFGSPSSEGTDAGDVNVGDDVLVEDDVTLGGALDVGNTTLAATYGLTAPGDILAGGSTSAPHYGWDSSVGTLFLATEVGTVSHTIAVNGDTSFNVNQDPDNDTYFRGADFTPLLWFDASALVSYFEHDLDIGGGDVSYLASSGEATFANEIQADGGITSPGAGLRAEQFGDQAAAGGTDGIAIGYQADSGTGTSNTVVGNLASPAGNGSNSTYMGYKAGQIATGGTLNAGFGSTVFPQLVSGDYCSSLGALSGGTNVSGRYNLTLGYYAHVPTSTTANMMVSGDDLGPLLSAHFGEGYSSATPQDFSIYSTHESGTDQTNATDFGIYAGAGTGTGDGADLIFGIHLATTTGSALGTETGAIEISGADGETTINRSVAMAQQTITGADTLDGANYATYADATSAGFTVTLPTAAISTGRIYIIKKIDTTGNAVTLDGNGSETIDGAATQVISTPYNSITVQSDGTEWWIQ